MKTKLVFILAALCSFANLTFAAEDLSATLQRGLFEEEANNNLDAAIKAYESVVAATDAQRKLAGTALFRLAECYRKLGRTNEAVAHYERVLREYPDQTRLADLSRRHVVTSAPAAQGTELQSERARMMERELVQAQAEQSRLSTMLGTLTNRARGELKTLIQSVSPDQMLSTLQEQLAKAEQRRAELKHTHSDSHPDVKSALAVQETLNRQIDERVDGIVAGIKLKVEAANAQVARLREQLAEARSAREVATSPSARGEQRRLLEEEIKIVQKEFDQLNELRKAGTVSEAPVSAKQRELLGLQRQLAGLTDVPAAASSFEERLNKIVERATGTPTDEEDKEVRRIQALIRDSPDLINAPDQASGSAAITPLHRAASKGQLVVARFLLENKANVNARRSGNLTPLHEAVMNGHKSVTELLLSNGAEVNASGAQEGTPLHYAAARGFKAIAEVLLANKANPNAVNSRNATPLHLAVDKGFQNLAELLLNAGVDVNTLSRITEQNANQYAHNVGTPLLIAVYDGNKALTELLLSRKADVNLRNQFSEAPLHFVGDRVEIADLLIRAGADVNARVEEPGDNFGKTPLCYAVGNERANVVEFLLKNGADPNVRFGNQNNSSTEDTLLTLAVNRNNPNERVITLLLEHKANPDALNKRGFAPLHQALFNANKAMAALLLKHGANVEVRDREGGNTPLCFMYGGRESIELLLDHKANPNAQNKEGNTPVHKLVERSQGNERAGLQELAELLIARGADVNIRNRQGLTPLNLYGVPAQPRYSEGIELAEVLRKAGAKDEQLDLVADPDSIRVWRKGMTSGRVVFVRDAAGYNRFTLMEAILNFYSLRYTPPARVLRTETQSSVQPGGIPPRAISRASLPSPVPVPGQPQQLPVPSLGGVTAFGGTPISNYDPVSEIPFPDLTRIRILRLVDVAKNEKKVIPVSLINAAGIVLCNNDVVLEFGDIIEIPEREYRLDEGRVGLSSDQNRQFLECLPRKVEFTVKGEATEVKLQPLTTSSYLANAMRLGQVRNVLRSTSDLSRLRITRRADAALGQKAVELTVDLEAFQRSGKQQWDDLWLRDGDVIDVPEKGQ